MIGKEIIFRDPVVERVVDKFVSRSDVGYKKYKSTLHDERTQKRKDLLGYLNDIQEELMDNIDMSWDTDDGSVSITPKTVKWIMKNAKVSMYNEERCYIYNKAFARFFDNNDPHETRVGGLYPTGPRSMDAYSPQKKYSHQKENVFDLIREWASERGLYENGDPKTQALKLVEEVGETCRAILKEDHDEVVDGIGDCVVVLTNLAELQGVSIEECIDSAYAEIATRKGKMVNGTFVKN